MWRKSMRNHPLGGFTVLLERPSVGRSAAGAGKSCGFDFVEMPGVLKTMNAFRGLGERQPNAHRCERDAGKRRRYPVDVPSRPSSIPFWRYRAQRRKS
ncbi:hypothetical protein KCP71_07155 [Salmonella enterica subsp. enterica]|nr:hypothetical protein KCP71_07155 [Salmonella enterica subsp. enterica]